MLFDNNHSFIYIYIVIVFDMFDLTRQASVALNVWQPEVVRGRHKDVVEQSVVPVESRVHAMEMELKLCRQQISGFERAYVSCEISDFGMWKRNCKE